MEAWMLSKPGQGPPWPLSPKAQGVLTLFQGRTTRDTMPHGTPSRVTLPILG